MSAVTCRACDWTHFNDAAVLQAAAEAAAQRSGGTSSTCSTQQEQKQQQPEQQQQAGNGDASSSVSESELLDLHHLVTTPWDIIIGAARRQLKPAALPHSVTAS
jgi:hypothetical protein